MQYLTARCNIQRYSKSRTLMDTRSSVYSYALGCARPSASVGTVHGSCILLWLTTKSSTDNTIDNTPPSWARHHIPLQFGYSAHMNVGTEQPSLEIGDLGWLTWVRAGAGGNDTGGGMWESSSDSIHWTSFSDLSQCLLNLPPNDETRRSYRNFVLFVRHQTIA